MIIATFTPEPTQPPVITQSSGTRYAQLGPLQSVVDTFEHWRQTRAKRQKVQRTYDECVTRVKRQSVLGHWDSDTQSYQLNTQCGNNPRNQQPNITIVRG